jgi:hypothetical protein
MHRISAAIGNYFNDFQAYPGVVSNQSFAGGAKPFSPGQGTYTQSEDLVMALMGGFQIDATTRQLKLFKDQIGLGPMNFNTVVVSPRKHAYIEKIPAELTPLEKGNMVPAGQVLDLGLAYASDSEVPEFMDAYTQPRPILYMRANASAMPANAVYNSKLNGGFNATFEYDVAVIQPYLKTSAPNDDFHDPTRRDTPTSTGFNGPNLDLSKKDANGNPWIRDYFTAKGSTIAKNAGSYMLLDAGADRVFGTDDDIIVGAGGGQ